MLSTSAVAYTSYAFFFLPQSLAAYEVLEGPVSLVFSAITGAAAGLSSLIPSLPAAPTELAVAFLMDNLTAQQDAQLVYGLEVLNNLAGTLLYVGFSVILLILLSSVLPLKGLALSITSISGALTSAVTPNLPFLASPEAVLSLLFLFLTLYFLEVHFFFIFTLGLSSEGLLYQFNFLLSGFLFIFIWKLWSSLATDSLFFSVAPLFSSYLFFKNGSMSVKSGSEAGSGSPLYLMGALQTPAFIIRGLTVSIFFFVTFIVWLLRYIIQFVSLLVLFMIHTVFEFAIISNDSYFSGVNQMGFFFFKSFFFIFLMFWGFLYLLVYLNLMFTLQAFIFFFFSEVFQSNFLFDLSAVVASRVHWLKSFALFTFIIVL